MHIRPENGERLGQWRLADRGLGLRHMAWATVIAAILSEAVPGADVLMASLNTVARLAGGQPLGVAATELSSDSFTYLRDVNENVYH